MQRQNITILNSFIIENWYILKWRDIFDIVPTFDKGGEK